MYFQMARKRRQRGRRRRRRLKCWMSVLQWRKKGRKCDRVYTKPICHLHPFSVWHRTRTSIEHCVNVIFFLASLLQHPLRVDQFAQCSKHFCCVRRLILLARSTQRRANAAISSRIVSTLKVPSTRHNRYDTSKWKKMEKTRKTTHAACLVEKVWRCVWWVWPESVMPTWERKHIPVLPREANKRARKENIKQVKK